MCALLDEARGWIVSFLGRAPSHGMGYLHLQLGGTEPPYQVKFRDFQPSARGAPKRCPVGDLAGPGIMTPYAVFLTMVNAVSEANQFTDCLFASGLD